MSQLEQGIPPSLIDSIAQTIEQARGQVAKLAQEFIEEHHGEAIRMEDLCRETGFGVRTVQRCFREYFDLTIGDVGQE